MKLMLIIVGFSVIAHVKCQLSIDELLYEEEEEDDEEGEATTKATTTTTTTTTTRAPTTVATAAPLVAGNATNFNGTIGNGTARVNQTFYVQPTNGTSIFSGAIQSIIQTNGATTERVHYVLGQVGNIFNNVGTLNITGIIDQALGIRNSGFARPLVTGIINAVLCNPVTFSENNCRKRT